VEALGDEPGRAAGPCTPGCARPGLDVRWIGTRLEERLILGAPLRSRAQPAPKAWTPARPRLTSFISASSMQAGYEARMSTSLLVETESAGRAGG
jgi:hypothetical protein